MKGILRPSDQVPYRNVGHKQMQDTSSLTDLANIISEPIINDDSLSVFDITHALGEYSIYTDISRSSCRNGW